MEDKKKRSGTLDQRKKLTKFVKENLTAEHIINRYATKANISQSNDKDYIVKCFLPGHKDKTASLSISKTGSKYKCFGGCTSSKPNGDFIDMIKCVENVDFNKAIDIAMEMCNNKNILNTNQKNIETKNKNHNFEIPQDTDEMFHRNLLKNEKILYKIMKDRGLSLDQIKANKIGIDKYNNITIPVYKDNRLISIKVRNAEKERPQNCAKKWAKYWFYSKKSGNKKITFSEMSIFNIDKIKDRIYTRIVICGGEFDAIKATSKLNNTLGITPTHGESSVSKELLEMIDIVDLADKDVYACMDNDPAGEKANKIIKENMFNATVVHLSNYVDEKGDVSDFINKYGFKEFVKILEDKKNASATSDNVKRTLISDQPISINPAFHITSSGKVFITSLFKRVKSKSIGSGKNLTEIEYMAQEPMIITSEREVFEVPRIDSDIKNLDPFMISEFLGMTCRQEPKTAQSRWAGDDVLSFLSGRKLFSNTKSIYMRIFNSINRYAKFSRKTYAGLVSLYIFGSYFYEIFPSYPYLHFNGKKASGKSTIAKAIKEMAFNGHFEVNPTVAVLARLIEDTKGLVVIDEAEQSATRKDGRSPLGQILNSGYQKGAYRTICDPENGNKPQSFDLYCPKIICNIYGLNDVTASRCITIKTVRDPNIVIKKSSDDDPELNDISKNMYEIMMGKSRLIIKAYKEVNLMQEFSPIDKSVGKLFVSGRTRELFVPILSIAWFIYKETGYSKPWDHILKELHFINNEKDDTENETPEELLKQVVIDIIDKDKGVDGMDITTHEIYEEYKLMHLAMKKDIGQWIGRAIQEWVYNPLDTKRKRKLFECKISREDGTFDVLNKKLKVYTITRDSLGIEKSFNNVPGELKIKTIGEREHIKPLKASGENIRIIHTSRLKSSKKEDLPF